MVTWGVAGSATADQEAESPATAEQALTRLEEEGKLKKEGLSFTTTTSFQQGEFYQIDDGIWIAMRNRLDHPDFYYRSLWEDNPSLPHGKQWIKWYDRGGMQLRRLIGTCSGDYLSFFLIMDPDKQLVLDETARVVMFYEDRVVVSEEILVPDSSEEKVVYRSGSDTIIFSAGQTKYFHYNSFFLFAARFPDNTIGKKKPNNEKDYDYPITFGIEKGGTLLLIPGDWSQVVGDGVTLSLLTTGN